MLLIVTIDGSRRLGGTVEVPLDFLLWIRPEVWSQGEFEDVVIPAWRPQVKVVLWLTYRTIKLRLILGLPGQKVIVDFTVWTPRCIEAQSGCTLQFGSPGAASLNHERSRRQMLGSYIESKGLWEHIASTESDSQLVIEVKTVGGSNKLTRIGYKGEDV